MSKSVRRALGGFFVAAMDGLAGRFELARLAVVFFAVGLFLLDVFFLALDAFFFGAFLATFLADLRFFLAPAFLLDFFFAAFFLAVFFLAVFFLAARFFDDAAFFEAFPTGFFFDVLRFDEGRAAFFATRFLLDDFFEAVFLRLGLFLAAAFFLGMEFISNGRVQKTGDYTEVAAERNTLRTLLATPGRRAYLARQSVLDGDGRV